MLLLSEVYCRARNKGEAALPFADMFIFNTSGFHSEKTKRGGAKQH